MRLLTRKELAEKLKVSNSTIIRMEQQGLLKPIRLNDFKFVRYNEEDIVQMLENNKKQDVYL